MNNFRLFCASVILPLLSVALCATGGGGNDVHRKHIHIREDDPPKNLPRLNAIPLQYSNSSISEDSIESPHQMESLAIHPHPLKLQVKGIKNSTTTQSRSSVEGRGARGVVLNELSVFVWIFKFLWRALTSYAVVAIANILLSPLLSKIGWNGPYWETSVQLGNEGKNPLFFPPSLKNFRLAFGSHDKGSKKEDIKDEGGWGWGAPGGGGWSPHGYGKPQYLSYDQYALALPHVDKKSQKAAKKYQKYLKKAHKYQAKAAKFAAKAQGWRLQVKPLLASSYIHPQNSWGFAGLPGVPGTANYGWG